MANRTRVQPMRWGAAAWAGLVAGAVLLALEFLLVPTVLGNSAWAPLQMIAAILLGTEVLPPPARFAPDIALVALLLHFVLAACYGLLLGVLVRGMPSETKIIAGAVFGLALYFVNYYVMTSVFPWFANARNWVSVFTHIAFGLTAGWVLASRSTRRLAGPY